MTWVLICDSVHSKQLYRVASLGNQAAITMSLYHTQSHRPDTKIPSPCPIQLMLSAELGSAEYQFL